MRQDSTSIPARQNNFTMTSIDRTAYPTLGNKLSNQELIVCYKVDKAEHELVMHNARSDRGYLTLAISLKTRQQLGYFPALADVPSQIVNFISEQLDVTADLWPIDETHYRTTLHRHRSVCRQYLGSSPFSDEGKKLLVDSVHKAAYTMSDPADLINVAIEALSKVNIELPAYSSLDRLVNHERQAIHVKLYSKISGTLTSNQRQILDGLLEVKDGERITEFARVKQAPGPATLSNFRAWATRLTQLNSILDPKPFFNGIAYTKIRQFAAEASAYALGDIRGVINDSKRYTLLLSLLHETQAKTRDELIDMFLRRMKGVHNSAKNKLRELQEKHRKLEESLIGVLGQVIHHADTSNTDEALGQQVRDLLENQGGIESIANQYKLVRAYHHNNYLPLLWPIHANNRAVIFRVLDQIQIKSSTQDQSLLRALHFVRQHQKLRKTHLPAEIDLRFASQRWQTFVHTKEDGNLMLDRRALEVCVFSYVAEALSGTDFYVEDSGEYADYRKQLLPLNECEERLPEYCEPLGLPASSSDLVASLKERLTYLAYKVDQKFPGNGVFTIDDDGVPHLKRQKASPLPEGLDDLKKDVYSRMPERHLLDILRDVKHWSDYTKHLGLICH